MDERRKELDKLKTVNDVEKDTIKLRISILEEDICELVAEENRNKVVDNFKQMENAEGLLHTNGMWSLKKKVFPNNKESLPFAKMDVDGKVITAQSQLKDLYIETFVHRLRHRPVQEDFKQLKYLNEELCARRLEYVKQQKTNPWTTSELRISLSSLKKTKQEIPMVLSMNSSNQV